MPVVPTTSRSPGRHNRNTPSSLLVFQPQAHYLFLETNTEDDYYYEPLATASDVYDTDIDNISDLDPNDTAAIRDFMASMGPSQFSTLGETSGDEEYDADDEYSEASMASSDIERVDEAEGRSMMAEEAEDESNETIQVEFTRRMAKDWTVDSEADQEAERPALARQIELAKQSNSGLHKPNLSPRSPRWMGRNLFFQRQAPDEKTPNVPRSPISSQNLSSIRGTIEHFNHFSRPTHYPEAAQFLSVDFSTGEFTNPFTTPPITNQDHSASPPSPFTRPNDYGLIENWNFMTRQEQVSPVSSLSNYSKFQDDGIPVSPLSEYRSQYDRPDSGVFNLEMGNTPLIFEPAPDRFCSLTSASVSSSGAELFSAKELIAQVNELLFDNAAYEFFSLIDVDGLLADRESIDFVLEDHDALHDSWELEQELPYRNWLPHEPKRTCHCYWCIEYWIPEDEEEMYQPHDFDHRCSCPVCQSFRCQETVREMEKREQEQRARDRDLEERRGRKRKRQATRNEGLDL